jgi:4-coumarate--CoA ligase (photoactive yellow protein activation family)
VGALVEALGPAVPERLLALHGRYALLVALAACWSRGELPVLPSSLAPEALRACGLPIVHDGDAPPGADALDVRAVLGRPARADPLLAPPDDRVVVALTTSGSTGAPRRVTKTWSQLVREADAHRHWLADAEGRIRRVVSTVPAHHVYGLLWGLLLPLRAGSVIHDDAPLLVEAVRARVSELGATVLVTVPAHLRGLDAPDLLRRVETIVSSGGPLPAATAERVVAVGGPVATEILGSTETGGIAWRQGGERWTPLPGVRVSADPEGRLHVDAPWLAPDDPRPRPADDRVALDDGGFRLLGRLDDVVKVASRRTSLGHVTELLLAAPGVRDAAVLPRVDGTRERLHALVALRDPSDATALPAVRRFLAERLDAVVVPRLHPVAALPREPTGKLVRARLDALVDRLRGEVPTRVELVVPIEPADTRFDGHFPGRPVLPAVVQTLDLVVAPARDVWSDLGPLVEARRLRFARALVPGDRVAVSLVREADVVRFTLAVGGATAASGSLRFAGPTAPP